MKKFKYTLAEDPKYPQYIFANSVNEVRSLLMENLASETSILSITEEVDPNTVNENANSFEQPLQTQMSNVHFEMTENNGTSEISSMNKLATTAMNSNIEMQTLSFPMQSDTTVKDKPTIIEKMPTKFFEEGGIKFKLEDGKLFKKVFEKLAGEEILDYRLLNKNGKNVSLESYSLERLVWKEI